VICVLRGRLFDRDVLGWNLREGLFGPVHLALPFQVEQGWGGSQGRVTDHLRHLHDGVGRLYLIVL
jgi:hypothetical protein